MDDITGECVPIEGGYSEDEFDFGDNFTDDEFMEDALEDVTEDDSEGLETV